MTTIQTLEAVLARHKQVVQQEIDTLKSFEAYARAGQLEASLTELEQAVDQVKAEAST